jgi:hypothetical protein
VDDGFKLLIQKDKLSMQHLKLFAYDASGFIKAAGLKGQVQVGANGFQSVMLELNGIYSGNLSTGNQFVAMLHQGCN